MQSSGYSCGDTFTNAIDNDIFALSLQIDLAVQAHPNSDVYIIGHSLGGVVAFGYMAALVEGKGLIKALPTDQNGKPLATIKLVDTLDSPLGGVSDRFVYDFFTNVKALTCNGLLPTMTAVDQLISLFHTAHDSKHRGESASIVQAILGGGIVKYPYISNQSVADDAERGSTKLPSITVLTEGNTNDGLWIPHTVCNADQDFSSTQWLRDEGKGVYSRVFTSKLPICRIPADSIEQSHKAVLIYPGTIQALKQIIDGEKFTAMKPAPR